MKITILGAAHPLRGGGITTFNERLATELQRQGHEVAIYSFTLQYPGFLFPGKTQTTDEPAPQGLRIVPLINSVNPLNWITVGLRLKREKPDLIVVRYWLPFFGPCFGTILRIAKRNKHSKVTCIADNILPHEKRPGDELFTKYFLPVADRFLVMSREVLAQLKTFTAKPAVYTPHPLYDNYGPSVSKAEARRRLGLREDGKYILFFGFIRKYKGLDLALQAMQDPAAAATGAELIIAGEYYGDQEFYQPMIEGLGQRVHSFTEFVPNEDVRYYFSAADLVIQPYRSATQSGITQIAYHFRIPMIVTNVGGLAEGVPDGETGFVTEPDPAALANAIVRFFDPPGIPNLDANLERERAKYGWEEFTAKLLEGRSKL